MKISSRFRRTLIALALSATIFWGAPISLACGPFTLSAVFTFTVHPEYPLERFAQGAIGVVQPTYARSYLYVVYRHLIGTGFNQEQQKAVVELWRDRLDFKWSSDGEDWVQNWLAARGKVPGVGAAGKIEVYRSREKPNEYETYLNCQQDAFANAVGTLGARISKFGAEHSVVKDWVTAQDQVFANCAQGQHTPTPAPADAEALVRSDRTYQIAAANFYAGNFAESRKLFASISLDSLSPWQQSAPYLIARTLVREASLGAPEKKSEPLAAAEKELNEILGDPALGESHAASKRLLSVVRLRLHPEARLHELAHSLLSDKLNETLKQDLWDYTLLLDHFVGDDEDTQKKDVAAEISGDELTDWIITFQSEKPEALEHSLEKWKAKSSSKSSLPWLVASLAKIDPQHPTTRELIAAASRVRPDSPAFASISFHTVRLTMQEGRFTEARAKLDDLLQKHRSQFNVSSLNLFLSQRMLLANNLDDFLEFAQRHPAAFSWDDDGREIPADEAEQSDETKSIRGEPLLDIDATQLMNRSFVLDLWRQAAESEELPTHLRRDVAQAAWTRAVLLGDNKTAAQLAPTLKLLIPELSSFLDDYIATKPAAEKRFAAIYTWLKFPGLEPVVDAGIGRLLPPGQQDSYRDNWWCTAAYPVESKAEEQSTGQEMLKTREPFNSIRGGMLPLFLTESQRAAGKREFAALTAQGAAPNYLCRQVIQFALKHAGDQRIPEALHLAVKTTRYGCTDKETARWSKATYDLLHKRYPGSVWAKRTPYWFKD